MTEETPQEFETFEVERVFFEKLDNTLENKRNIKLMIPFHNNHIAFTDQKNINLNFKVIKEKTDDYEDFLGLCRGLNYHELSHIMNTKYTAKGLSEFIKSRNKDYDDTQCFDLQQTVWNNLNLLEDGRIELLFTWKYPRARHHFIKAIYKIILAENGTDDKDFLSTGLLLYGRRKIHQNKKLTEKSIKLMREFLDQKTTQQAIKIIDSYLGTTSTAQQYELAIELYKLVGRVKQQAQQHQETYRKDKQFQKKELNSIEEMKEQIADDSQQEKENNKTAEEANNKQSMVQQTAEIKELINEELNKVNELIKDDVKAQMEAMQKGDFAGQGKDDSSIYNTRWYAQAQHKYEAKRLSTIIKRLRCNLGNNYRRKQKKGRVDMRAVMNTPQFSNKVFKRYIPSKLNKTKMGVSLFLDSSGSMEISQFNLAISTAYTISKALEDSDSRVQVVEYSSQYKTMKKFSDHTETTIWNRSYCGNTYLSEPMQENLKTLIALGKEGYKNRLAIIVTDGIFSDTIKVREQLINYRKNNISVILIMVKKGWHDAYDKDLYTKVIYIDRFDELTTQMEKVIVEMQRKKIIELERD